MLEMEMRTNRDPKRDEKIMKIGAKHALPAEED